MEQCWIVNVTFSRVKLLKSEEPSGGDSKRRIPQHKWAWAPSCFLLRPLSFAGLLLCGFCVIYSELQNTGHQELCCRKSRSSGGKHILRESLRRPGEDQSAPALLQPAVGSQMKSPNSQIPAPAITRLDGATSHWRVIKAPTRTLRVEQRSKRWSPVSDAVLGALFKRQQSFRM